MKALPQKLVLALLALIALNAPAITRYVDVNNPNALSPFLDWSTAATNIQDAVDAALDGDEIVVTNGIYATGGRAVGTNIIVNRVVVDKPLTLRSVNGPAFTIIQGYQVPGTTNGDAAIRCVYLTNGASLFGFTLTKGATRTNANLTAENSGGGLFCAASSSVASNCVMIGNSASSGGGGSRGGNLYNCTLDRNLASFGGGAISGRLNDCILTNNTATFRGGGAYLCSATNCSFIGNSAYSPSPDGFASGGGAYFCPVLFNCTLSGNTAQFNGGGATSESGSTSLLYNCILTNNSAFNGGGTWNVKLMNCTLIGNRASAGGGANFAQVGAAMTNCTVVGNLATNAGGGIWAVYGTVNNCMIVGNGATNFGGGVAEAGCCGSGLVLNNCSITGNSASVGGGVYLTDSVTDQQLINNNCIVYSNIATNGTNFYRGTLNYSCTTPQPVNGIGNITNAPLFVDSAGGNFRLQANSPCINAGNNAYATMSTDLDGSPRIAGGTVDMGAYEFPFPASTLSYAWAPQYGLPTDGTVDSADPDGDGANNWHESHADTIPTNALSVLRMVNATNSPTGAQVAWQSVATRNYWLERATNLGFASPFQIISNNIAGAAGTKTVTDPSATNAGPYFYRVGVQ